MPVATRPGSSRSAVEVEPEVDAAVRSGVVTVIGCSSAIASPVVADIESPSARSSRSSTRPVTTHGRGAPS